MRIVVDAFSAEVDLVECEAGARCTFERRCRIHALYDFFKQAGLVAERSSLELPPPKPAMTQWHVGLPYHGCTCVTEPAKVCPVHPSNASLEARQAAGGPTVVDVLCQEIERATVQKSHRPDASADGFPRECEFGRID